MPSMNSGGLTPEQHQRLKRHLPFVRHLAGKLAAKLPASVDIEDLEGAGRIGLLQAVQSYDEGMDNTFLTYCKHRIRGAMLDEIRSMDWIGRTYRARGGALPSMSSFSCFTDEDDPNPVEPADHGVTAERSAEADEMVQWFLARLSLRDARIIWAYHGPEQMTYKEIGHELGISEGRVSHLYHKAIRRMKTMAAEKLDYDPI